MARDLMKTVERVHIDKDVMDKKGNYAYSLYGDSVAPEYDLSLQDMQGLYDILSPAFSKPCLYPDNGEFVPSTDFMDRLYEVFSTAFAYGYVLGHRATVAGKYRELKETDIHKEIDIQKEIHDELNDVVNKGEEREIIVHLHQRGEDKFSPTAYTVGDVDDFELLFAISTLAEKFANTKNCRAKTSDEIINMIRMAAEAGVNGEVEEYARDFIRAIMALKEIRARNDMEEEKQNRKA